jgi:hypothetical protein
MCSSRELSSAPTCRGRWATGTEVDHDQESEPSGRARVVRRDLRDLYDWRAELREIRDVAGAALIRFDVTASGARSGVRIEQSYWPGRVRNGAVDYLRFFGSDGDALKALAAV